MKDILKIIRFDFLTVKPLAMGGIFFAVLLFGILSLLFSPIIASFITFGAIMFVIPLQSIADKNDFNKLYGTLPVKRRNITRARFIYIWLVHFAAELLELVIAAIAKLLKLYRILPGGNGEMMQFVKDSFTNTKSMLFAIIGLFTIICLLFSFIEMMGQIHGKENESKVIMITIGVLALLAFAFAILSEHDLIPVIKLPSLPESVSGMLILCAVMDVIMLGVCLLFGEITAGRLAKREL